VKKKHFVAEEAGYLFFLVPLFFKPCSFHKKGQIDSMYEVRQPQDIKSRLSSINSMSSFSSFSLLTHEITNGILITIKLNVNKLLA
jgi:hypothetical protein